MNRRRFMAGSLAGLGVGLAQGSGRGAQEPTAEAFALIDTPEN